MLTPKGIDDQMDEKDKWQNIATWASGGAAVAYGAWTFAVKLTRMVRGSGMTTLNIAAEPDASFGARLTTLENSYHVLQTRQDEMHTENVERNDALMQELRAHRTILDKILSKMAGI